MHLLDVDTQRLETFYGAHTPRYAILSHTWAKEEVTFSDMQDPTSPRVTSLAGFDKIRKTCDQAKRDRFQYAWIDTCCIDKSSSVELSEAINSMFQWYRDAAVCYAYLSDVAAADFEESFPRTRWFTRGWTLQELLAPKDLEFYDHHWEYLGTRSKHSKLISEITRIDENTIRGFGSLGSCCIAKRMSWASARETTRVEDMAYCLLGIFQINMPLLYGEGERAFIRLQEEIIERYKDDSIFAWGMTPGLEASVRGIREAQYVVPLLVDSPGPFKNCH